MKYPCQKAKDLQRCANACLKKVNFPIVLPVMISKQSDLFVIYI